MESPKVTGSVPRISSPRVSQPAIDTPAAVDMGWAPAAAATDVKDESVDVDLGWAEGSVAEAKTEAPVRQTPPPIPAPRANANQHVVRRAESRPLAKGTDAVAPLTWDQNTPAPSAAPTPPPMEGTERTPTFEPADFGEGENERTVVTSAAYELRPRFTGRAAAIAKLQALTDTASRSASLRSA
jgi:hypothetical protein